MKVGFNRIVVLFVLSLAQYSYAETVFLRSDQDLAALFPQTVTDVQDRTSAAITDARDRLEAILTVDNDKRTYANTMDAYDQLMGFSPLLVSAQIAETASMVLTDAAARDAAREAGKQIAGFMVDEISNNEALYNAIKAYATTTQEILSDEQRYFITETLAEFKRGGLDLPQDKRAVVAALKKDLTDLSITFLKNIAADTQSITVSQEDLAGLSDDFIGALKKTDDGQYVLGTDYPTYFGVLENCSVENTRKQLNRAFDNRAYPANEEVLKVLIAKRDELARALGFESYAHLDLDNQMVKHPDNADAFLSELVKRSTIKEQAEFEALIAELPESVELTSGGKLKLWDGAYVRAQYKKKHFNLDERVIAEYFPMEQTLQRLLTIYEEFMGLTLTVKSVSNLWHEDVKVVEAYDTATQQLLGYLLLDLHPRPGKFTHACCCTLVPAVTLADGSQPCAAFVVIANFPKSTASKPSLFRREDVRVFFHEFGHALHGLLGRTHVASCSGMRVKMDFAEMPSQMLEEWLWEKTMLKRVSSHYVTGEPLSDELIDNIMASKHFNTGAFLQRQAYLSLVSLNYFKAGADKDCAAMMRDIFVQTCPTVAHDNETHKYASFGHLTEYGAKYYGYMWSKVFALDLFGVIKTHGMNHEIGKKYVTEVLSKGGSKDPMDLLVAFLGRAPQQDAFFRDLGL